MNIEQRGRDARERANEDEEVTLFPAILDNRHKEEPSSSSLHTL